MKTDDKTRRALNAGIEAGEGRVLAQRQSLLEQRVARIETEPPPSRGGTEPMIAVTPPRPTPRAFPPPLPKIGTPTEPFRPRYASDPDLARQVEEERVRREWETEAQKRYAKGREDIDTEIVTKLDDLAIEQRDHRTALAILARAHGVEGSLPASIRSSTPPPAGGDKPARPAVPALRRATKGVELAAVLGFLTILGQIVLEVLKRTGAP